MKMQKRTWALCSAAALLSVPAQAAKDPNQPPTLAIIDSGLDHEHASLQARIWVNTEEIRDNGRDDDQNGFRDDYFGWNFAENSSEIIDYSYLGSFSPTPYRFFELQLKQTLGNLTESEKEEMTKILDNPEKVRELQTFGNFVHGTHVAGIAQSQASSGQLMGLKIIPTEIKLPFQRIREEAGLTFPLPADWTQDFRQWVLRGLLGLLARAQGVIMGQVGEYLATQGTEVANGSFGASEASVAPILELLLNVALGRAPSAEELQDYSTFFLQRVVEAQSVLVDRSPQTLFVFAAGNEGSDNDLVPVSPANIKRSNSLAVAATSGTEKLATFSNFGEKMVDIAAPGTAILSTIPGDETLALSGTSQAAPYVAGIALAIKAINPQLSPEEVKLILMETVEKMAFLEGKVASGGIASAARAKLAAEKSLTLPLNTAIEESAQEIPQGAGLPAIWRASLTPASNTEPLVFPLPSGIHF